MEALRVQNLALRSERDAALQEAREANAAAVSTAKSHAGELLAQGSGLDRRVLFDDAWHAAHPSAAHHLYGFDDWSTTKDMMFVLFLLEPPIFDTTKPIAHHHITDFEQALLTKMRFHIGYANPNHPYSLQPRILTHTSPPPPPPPSYTHHTLALICGRDRSTITPYIQTWAPKWGEAGEDISILDITGDFLDATCPQSYKDQGLLNVGAVPDGKDFAIEVPRTHTLLSRSSYSDKIHHSAARCISWSAPSGLSFEHTDPFFGRPSEPSLVELWGPRLAKVPPNYSMLSDRGFAGTAHLYPHFNAQLTPNFLAGRPQFTVDEIRSDYDLCKLRYTCEVDFSRVTLESGLKDTIRYEFFPIITPMVHWGHANVNLRAPLQT